MHHNTKFCFTSLIFQTLAVDIATFWQGSFNLSQQRTSAPRLAALASNRSTVRKNLNNHFCDFALSLSSLNNSHSFCLYKNGEFGKRPGEPNPGPQCC